MKTSTKLSGRKLLMMLENAQIQPEDLTPEQRESVLDVQTEIRQEHTKERRRFRAREESGIRTRFGLGSWDLPTDKAVKQARTKSKRKLKM